MDIVGDKIEQRYDGLKFDGKIDFQQTNGRLPCGGRT